MVANILLADLPPLDPRGQTVKIQLFQNMLMLPIKLKGIKKYSNMVANILHTDPPLTPHSLDLLVKRSKFHFFRTWSCCISNSLESRNILTWKQLFYTQPSPSPLTLRVNRSKFNTFSEQCHVSYEIKGDHKCSNMVANVT